MSDYCAVMCMTVCPACLPSLFCCCLGKGRRCSHPVSLHPCSPFPSVTVIFERLDWRQGQKRELKVGDMFFMPLSLYVTVSLLPFLKSCSSILQLLITLNLFSLFWSFTCLLFSLLLFLSLPRSLTSLSLPLSPSPSLSLVFRQWNICCLNILPHYLSV